VIGISSLSAASRRARGRLCHGSVDVAVSRRIDQASLYPLVQREPGVAHPRGARLLLPTTFGPSHGAQRVSHPALEADALAGSKERCETRADHRLHRRARTERAADQSAYLGAEGRDPDPAAPLQLDPALRYRGPTSSALVEADSN